ncbi:hypothetical protein D9M69_604690 [compost metagenome]
MPRSKLAAAIARRQPPFSSPTSASSGTFTSSKKTSLKSDSPVIWRMDSTRTPGLFMSTSRKLIPLWRAAAVSVRASTKQWSAMCANEVHTLWPLST